MVKIVFVMACVLFTTGKYPSASFVNYPDKIHRGILQYRLSKPHKVLLALYDEDNKRGKIYVNNEIKDRGTYECRYEISDEDMHHKKFYLRLYEDGTLMDEILIKPDE